MHVRVYAHSGIYPLIVGRGILVDGSRKATDNMNFQERIESIERDMQRNQSQLDLFKVLIDVFAGVDLPQGVNIWANTYAEYTVVEFSAGYGEEADKDLQPLVHRLCQHFNVTFDKRKNYDGSSLEYIAWFNHVGRKWKLAVNGVVPRTCTIVEREEPLSDEDYAAAIAEVKRTRIVREIHCTDADDVEVSE